MKTRAICNGVAMVLCSASGVLAATGAREDNSGLYVWIFLGLCALIVVVQVIPAVMLMLGFVKALGKERKTETLPADSK